MNEILKELFEEYEINEVEDIKSLQVWSKNDLLIEIYQLINEKK